MEQEIKKFFQEEFALEEKVLKPDAVLESELALDDLALHSLDEHMSLFLKIQPSLKPASVTTLNDLYKHYATATGQTINKPPSNPTSITTNANTPAVNFYFRRPNAKYRLICFPGAGGRAVFWRNLARQFPQVVEVGSVEYPGRGYRNTEPRISDCIELALSLFPGMLPHLDKPFAFLGHSVGSQIAFEIFRLLKKNKYPLPRCLVGTSRWAPSYNWREIPFHAQHSLSQNPTDEEMVKYISHFGGLPPNMDPTILKMLLNEFRSDFSLINDYKYIPETEEDRFDIPVAVFAGKDDGTVTEAALTSWKKHTNDFVLKLLPGNHTFFMNNEEVFQQFISDLYTYIGSKME